MAGSDWLLTSDGKCDVLQSIGHYQVSAEFYRLYHFLSDIDNILKQETSDRRRLQMISPLVRRLLMSSVWLQSAVRQPDPTTGWSLLKLYDEPYFPWTLQTTVWRPGHVSPIHNHATWGIVAIIGGQEKNTFWKRIHHPQIKDAVEQVDSRILVPGDMLCMMPDAIHCIETVSQEPTISFNVYGQVNGAIIYFNQV